MNILRRLSISEAPPVGISYIFGGSPGTVGDGVVDVVKSPRSHHPGVMIYFLCPYCGVKLKVKEKLAGSARPCPKCNRGFRVPAPDANNNAPAGRAVDAGSRREQSSAREKTSQPP